MIKVINSSEFNENIEGKSGVTVVDFFATWCGPCKFLSPVFESLSEEMNDNAKFVKVDIDQSIDLADKYQVSSVPTVVIMKDGVEVDRSVGFVPKDTLKKKINAYV